MLPDESILHLTPGIYQKKVKKNFEVRVTFFGEEYIAVKIHNSEELDWRILSCSSKLKLSPITLPDDIEKKCISLMEKLGIYFGCFDFIVTPDDDFIFLEVNEMGQFLWIEFILPELKMLDKFCDFLISNDIESKPITNYQASLEEVNSSASYKKLMRDDAKKNESLELSN